MSAPGSQPLTFHQLNPGDALYFLQNGVEHPHSYCIAFLPDTSAPKSSIALKESWTEQPGVYLFLNIAPDQLPQNEFIEAVRDFLNEPIFYRVRFLWIENPTIPWRDWRRHSIAIDDPAKPGQSATVRQSASFDLNNVTLVIPLGTIVTLNATHTGFTWTQETPDFGAYLETGFGAVQLQGIITPIELPLQGEGAGCLQFDLTLRRPPSSDFSLSPNTPAYAELIALDIGMRVFFKDPMFPGDEVGFSVTSRRFPFLAEEYAALEHYDSDLGFAVTLDPLHPLAADRTYFGFVNASNNVTAIAIPSGYRTNFGYTVHLTPCDRASRFIFAEMPPSSHQSLSTPYYLVPSGNFEITVPRYRETATPEPAVGMSAFLTEAAEGSIAATSSSSTVSEDNLLCGISGVEYIKLAGDRTNLLCFRSGCAAFAPGFDPAQPTPTPSNGEAPLTTFVTTSWAYVRCAEQIASSDRNRGETKLKPIETSVIIPDEARLEPEEVIRESSEEDPEVTLEEPKTARVENLTTSVEVMSIANSSTVLPIYCAQPDQAVLHQPSKNNSGDEDAALLLYLEVPTAPLPDLPPNADLLPFFPFFPLFPYGEVQADVAQGIVLTDYQQIELQVVSSLRRSLIQALTAPSVSADGSKVLSPPADMVRAVPMMTNVSKPPVETGKTGTTPQGLLAHYSTDYSILQALVLAKDTRGELLQLQELEARSPIRMALQSNQVFLVISDPTVFQKPDKSSYFVDNQLTIKGWTFNLNPNQWRKDTILIFKFYDKPLKDLLDLPNAWSQSEIFTNNQEQTRSTLAALLGNAIQRSGKEASAKDKENYGPLARIALSESWSGILAFNVPVPLDGLPDELAALGAGIDPKEFYAQYVGIDSTPIKRTGTTLDAEESSLFGLIDYENDEMPLPSPSGYNFQVNSLRVLFQNSQVKAFSAEVTITLDRLFGEKTALLDSPSGRNIIILQGTAENHDGYTTYAFSFNGSNHFTLPDSAVFNEVVIIKAQLSTDPPTGSAVTGRFAFWGQLNFRYSAKFDILSFGAEPSANSDSQPLDNDKFLSFSNLVITMTFQSAQSSEKVAPNFAFVAKDLAFDLQRSQVRKNSLYAKFPLKLSAFIASSGKQKPTDSGFMVVKNPLGSGELGDTWYGLVYDLNLGTVGAMAGQVGLIVSVIVAWSPAGDSDSSTKGKPFVGLRLFGSSSNKKEFSIQGVLKIVFKSIEFVVIPPDPEDNVGYLLKLKNITLKLLVLSLPPKGQTEIIIFGDPKSTAESNAKTVGWYAAYAREAAKLPPTQAQSQPRPVARSP